MSVEVLKELDLEFVRSNFSAFSAGSLAGWHFFENAGGSYACRQTIEALQSYYTETKVQPYGTYQSSIRAGDAMDLSYARWAEALGVAAEEVHFGPSTSMNTYVLAHALEPMISHGDEIIVTNQDHEANTGAVRRMARAAGAKLKEWTVDPETGLLDPAALGALLSPRTSLVTFPHCSNIVGQENDVAALTRMAHEVGARVVVDGVSFAPHTFPDLGVLDPDVYLFSLYKTYSVHQGLMVVRNGLIDEVPNQGHFFNEGEPGKRLTPAGPDHAQVAAAAAVLEYVEALDAHHGGSGGGLHGATRRVSAMWRSHESLLLEPVLEWLAASGKVRLIGPDRIDAVAGLYRSPTVAFLPLEKEPGEVAAALAERQIMAGAGHFYAKRLIEAVGVDPDRGVVRVSWVHYTSLGDIARLLDSLADVLG